MAKDNCVACGSETPYDFETHIDMRNGYIEGVGQLCINCYNEGSKKDFIAIPKHYVKQFSNDLELGAAVRRFYYNNY
jgi:hypothetical protein